jgi:hypothetical protein
MMKSRSRKVHMLVVRPSVPASKFTHRVPLCGCSNQNGLAEPNMSEDEKDVTCQHCWRIMMRAKLTLISAVIKKVS